MSRRDRRQSAVGSRQRGRLVRFASALAVALLAGCATTSRDGDDDDAIAWQDWTPATFERARVEGKPILVRVSAGWCHWCHVMDDTTDRDPAVRELIARSFVAVRVDADARPDVADRYRRWGWPATAVLDPAGSAVLERRGYVPPRDYAELLRGVAADHRAGRPIARVEAPRPRVADPDLAAALIAARAQLDATWDEAQAGWGTGQKYPLAAPIEHALVRPDDVDGRWRARALRTLEAQRALLDPVWGGMFQYSVDGVWTRPHFEKVAAVQAEAIASYALAARAMEDEDLAQIAHDVHGYVVNHLGEHDGFTAQGFHPAQAADPPPETGLDGAAFYALDIDRRQELEGPPTDPAVYTDSSARLAVAILALDAVHGVDVLRDDARDILRHIVGPGGSARVQASHRLIGGGPGFLADQVAAVELAVALAFTGEPGAREAAVALAEGLVEARKRREAIGPRADLFTSRIGGFVDGPEPRPALDWSAPPFHENARAARVLLRLEALTGDPRWGELARATLRLLASDPAAVESWGRLIGDYVLALEEAQVEPITALVVAAPDDSRDMSLVEAAGHAVLLRVHVRRAAPGDAYPLVDGKPTLYVCGASACAQPVTDPAAAERAVREFVAAVRR